jgi:ribonuclease HI
MYFNGSVMKEGAGVGLVLISPLGVHMEYMVQLHFPTSNNVTEYEALINGLRIAVEIRVDSELVVDQVMKEKNRVDPKMVVYCQAVRDLEGKFHGLELHHVLRDYNKATNILIVGSKAHRRGLNMGLLFQFLRNEKTLAY